MISNRPSAHNEPKMIERSLLLQYLQSGLESNSFQFIRQAVVAWLASYPGDLEINLLFVKALVKEGRELVAAPVLDKILRTDPEYLDALRVGESLYSKIDATRAQQAAGMIQVLGSTPTNSQNLPVWSTRLFMARQALKAGLIEEAQASLFGALIESDCPNLAGATHLQIVEKQGDLGPRLNLGRLYHSRWPDCLQISLLLAKTWMEADHQDEAVSLLHECAALDPVGQVPQRLWGADFEFKPLYPEKMQIVENFAIPAPVAGKFGLNNLSAGEIPQSSDHSQIKGTQRQSQGVTTAATVARTEVHSFDGYKVQPTAENEYPDHPHGKEESAKPKNETLVEIQKEFEKIADHLKTPGVVRADNRYPAYVILSTKTGLAQQYGQQSAQVILEELNKLGLSIANRNGWHAVVFFPDDMAICGKYGITPVDAIDPWKIKLALVDLDAALAKTGEMIGCVLVVGGDKVVPFHNLPNPTDDADATVPSDNPYGSLDKNYFVSDWPVGRLPGDSSADSGLLLSQIRNATAYHSDEGDSQSLLNQIVRILMFWNHTYSKNFTNLGYTAAVWQRSSLSAFRPMGEGRKLFLSPNNKTNAFNATKIASAPYCYFNLHGVEDGSDWYGQKDGADTSGGEDFPVALQPSLLKKNLNSPRIIFTEACYGGHILGKTEDESMALTFLGQGVLAMIASTTIAYGSVTTPLIGGDLLGNLVMSYLSKGQSIGAAFLKAKVDFVREMNLRQGYLDGEDQKTLISFVLFGDPLVAYDPYQAMSKTVSREKNHPVVKIVVDQAMDETKSSAISARAIANAKEMARDYLPGIEYAEVRVSQQHVRINGNSHVNPNGHSKGNGERPSSRMVVSFSKQVTFDHHIHRQYARVTLDQQGKVVKMAISR